jgi:hypothetical protein
MNINPDINIHTNIQVIHVYKRWYIAHKNRNKSITMKAHKSIAHKNRNKSITLKAHKSSSYKIIRTSTVIKQMQSKSN